MTEIQTFTFSPTPDSLGVDDCQIRVCTTDDGAPVFVQSDVLAVLGINRSSSALLDDDEKGVHTMDTPGGPQTLAVVTEAGLYSLILRSRKPEAKRFKRWVTHEVLPSIRRHGIYGTPQTVDDLLADPRTMIRVLTEFAAEKEARQAAEAQVAALEPPARAWDALADAHGDYAVADVAKILARDPGIITGPTLLFRWLGKHRWLYRRGDAWHAMQDKINAGLLTQKSGVRTGQTNISAGRIPTRRSV